MMLRISYKTNCLSLLFFFLLLIYIYIYISFFFFFGECMLFIYRHCAWLRKKEKTSHTFIQNQTNIHRKSERLVQSFYNRTRSEACPLKGQQTMGVQGQ